MLNAHFDNLLLNGDFSPDLCSRLSRPDEIVECPVWRRTFAADRWAVSYAAAKGAAVSQTISTDAPAHAAATRSVEIRGAHGLAQPVAFGQRIEAADAPRYRRRVLFSAWIRHEHPDKFPAHFGLTFRTAPEPDDFGGPHGDRLQLAATVRIEEVPTGRWWLLEREIDARGFAPHGLAVEMEFPAEMLSGPEACLRITGARLADAAAGCRHLDRHPAIERQLTGRFFQRHDATTVNSLGRALVVNAHELHFQFTFPEMRAFPAVTLPHDESQLRVFNLEGIPQSGFTYDITHRSRGSFILRATKADHGLRDAFLSFVGYDGAILLDAEL